MGSVLSVSLPEKTSSEIEKFAKITGRSKSDIVRESINVYLWEAQFRKMQKRLSVKAKQRGIVSKDDVFKGVS